MRAARRARLHSLLRQQPAASLRNGKRMPSDYQHVRRALGYIAATPTPTSEELRRFYEATYYLSDNAAAEYQADYSKAEIDHKKLLTQLMFHAVEQARPEFSRGTITMIEFGCGEGFTLAAARERGWHTTGVDFTSTGAAAFNPAVVPAILIGDMYDSLEQLLSSGRQFDLCVLQHVLEHVRNSEELVDKIKNLVTPRGVLAITVPNDFSQLQQRALELGHIDREFWFVPPEHLNYFGLSSLTDFLAAHGFRTLQCYGSFPIDFFLFHPGCNYVMDSKLGKLAHQARVQIDLLLAQSGLDRLLHYYEATAAVGLGRTVTIIAGLEG
jgi:SAM-dependent methyltransferase